MSDRQHRDLIAPLEDWGQLVIRAGTVEEDGPDGVIITTWRAARDEARMAYGAWRQSHGREAYAVYRAAADREDAAQATVALVRATPRARNVELGADPALHPHEIPPRQPPADDNRSA